MRIVRSVGSAVAAAAVAAGHTLRVLRHALGCAPRVMLRRRGFRSVVEQMYFSGVKALGVTTVVALFTGMIVALQGGIELKKFGQAERIGVVVAASMCREMGPMITAIILTSMVGSTIAAQLGTMKVSEEIDALEVMSIDPVRLLVTPRVVGVTLMTFVLTVWVDLVGTMGGALVAVGQLDVPLDRYLFYARSTLEGRDFLGILPKDVYSGLVKSVIFGLLISSVACTLGLRARGGALGVGTSVRLTVVASVILILIFGYLLTSFFYA